MQYIKYIRIEMAYKIYLSCHIIFGFYLQYGIVLSNSILDSSTAGNLEMMELTDNMYRFNFKTRSKNGERVAVMSFKIDPERDRRSILVPDGEELLREISLPQFRHSHHSFITPISDSLSEYNSFLPIYDMNSFKASLSNKISTETQYKRKATRASNHINSTRKKLRRKYKDKFKSKRNKMKRRMNKKNRINKSHPKLYGQEACDYKILKSCSKKSNILPKRVARYLTDYQKCGYRQKFLYCIEKRRYKRKCQERTRTRGNITKLRAWINEAFRTSYSCLLNESMAR